MSDDTFGDALDAKAGAVAQSSGDPFGDALTARAEGKDSPATSKGKAPRSYWEQVAHNLYGEAQIAGAAIGNIPSAAGNAAIDLGSRITGFGPQKDTIPQFEPGEAGKDFQNDVKEAIPESVRSAPHRAMNAIESVSPTTADVLRQTGDVAGDVANLAPLGGAVSKGASILRDAKAAKVTGAQAAVDKSYGMSGQNMGAAAAAPNIADLSMPLQSAMEDASAGGTKALNFEAAARHAKADEFGVQLTKGQATGDARQLADEFNTRNQNPAFAERKVQTNQKLIDGLNGIKEDVAPGAAVDHESNAQTVIDAYKNKYAPIAADASAKWNKFQEAAGGALPLEPGDFTAQIGAALKKSGKTNYLPSEVARDIKDIDDGEPFTVERWDNLKTNLAGAQRTAEKSGNGNAGLAVKAARDAVENYQFPNLDPKLAALNNEARQATAQKYAMLRADPAMDTAVNDGVPRGQLSPEAKGYMEKYFLKGDKASLAQAQRNLSDSEDAKGAIAGSVTNELKKAAGIDLYRNDGNFSQSGYNTRLNEMQPRIKYLMPGESADKAFRLGDVARDAMRQPVGPAFGNSGTSTVSQVAKRIGSGVVGTAEHLANAATGKLKLGTGAREEIQNWMDSKWVSDSLKPGAGIEK